LREKGKHSSNQEPYGYVKTHVRCSATFGLNLVRPVSICIQVNRGWVLERIKGGFGGSFLRLDSLCIAERQVNVLHLWPR